MSEAMVRLEAVEKSYGAVRALSATSLEIAKGEFLTLLGPSGSGKTTILNLISGSATASAAMSPACLPTSVNWAWCFRTMR